VGLGFLVRVAPTLRVATHVSVGLDLQFQYLRAVTGTLSQAYYADDPFIAGDQTAAQISDADFTFRMLRARGMAFVEARF
jgi:hypothetical protein